MRRQLLFHLKEAALASVVILCSAQGGALVAENDFGILMMACILAVVASSLALYKMRPRI